LILGCKTSNMTVATALFLEFLKNALVSINAIG
jgi:hypothetical protein